MGAEAKRHQLNEFLPFFSRGELIFLSFPDFLLSQSAAQNGSGLSNIYGSFVYSGVFGEAQRFTDFASFFQDDIRVTPRLTVNAGLRYEFFGLPSDVHGRLPNFDPATADPVPTADGTFSGIVLPANYKGPLPAGVIKQHDTGLWDKNFKNFAPRVGLALRLLDSPGLVLRGGYGIYYQRISGDTPLQTITNLPFVYAVSQFGAVNGAATLQVPFNPPVPPASSFPFCSPVRRQQHHIQRYLPVGQYSPIYSSTVSTFSIRSLRIGCGKLVMLVPREHTCSACVQFNQALIATPQNPVNGVTTTTVENLSQRLPYLGVGTGSDLCENTLTSHYNALQTSLTKRLSHGLNLLASYTWSRSLDISSGNTGTSSLDEGFITNDQTNLGQAYGPSDFDRSHRFIFNFVYQTPNLGRGPRVAQHLLSGWQLSGIGVLQSGVPITVIDSTAGSVYGNFVGYTRGECTGANPNTSGSLNNRLGQYFNPSAFTTPPTIGDGTGSGSCGKGIVRSPHQRNLDLGIERTFRTTGKTSVLFRGEFLNFRNISSHCPSPIFSLFGVISSTASNPRIVRFALKFALSIHHPGQPRDQTAANS